MAEVSCSDCTFNAKPTSSKATHIKSHRMAEYQHASLPSEFARFGQHCCYAASLLFIATFTGIVSLNPDAY